MSPLSKYSQILIDHQRQPRHSEKARGVLSIHNSNPLCGDQVDIYYDVQDGVLANVCAEAKGCMIIKASASMLSDWAEGKSIEEYIRQAGLIRRAVIEGEEFDSGLGDWTSLVEVANYPARENCALLPWETLEKQLKGT